MTLWRLGVVAAAGKRAVVALGGYIVAGNTPSKATTYQKNTFSTDTLSTLTATVDAPNNSASNCYSTTNGYVLQAATTGRAANKLSYATETRSLTGNIIAEYPGAGHAGKGLNDCCGLNSSTNGYLCGGLDESSIRTTNINKFNFSTESTAVIAAGLSSGRRMVMGTSSSTFGYAANGRPAGDVHESIVQKVTFSTDAVSTLGTGLSNSVFGGNCFYSTTAGYMGGGSIPSNPIGANYTTINKFAFSDDSRTTLSTGLATGTTVGAGNESSTAGYVSGGLQDDNVPRLSTRYKWAFSDDSRSTLSDLPVAANNLSFHSHKVAL